MGVVGARPAPPEPAPAGYRWAVHEDPDWRILGPGTAKRCRHWRAHRGGGPLAVAELRRRRASSYHVRPVGFEDSWWAYCADHMYGRWIEAGRVNWYRLEYVRPA